MNSFRALRGADERVGSSSSSALESAVESSSHTGSTYNLPHGLLEDAEAFEGEEKVSSSVGCENESNDAVVSSISVSAATTAAIATDSQRRCKYWNVRTQSGCINGSKCKFRHDKPFSMTQVKAEVGGSSVVGEVGIRSSVSKSESSSASTIRNTKFKCDVCDVTCISQVWI